MSTSQSRETIELEVANFGPIVEGRVDLRPLTVFVGPSNTGKSYLAILIYALHKYFGNDLEASRRRYPRAFRSFHVNRREFPKKESDALAEFVRNVKASKLTGKADRSFILSSGITDIIRSGFNSQQDSLSSEICRCFGIGEAKDLIRKWSRTSAVIKLNKCSSESESPFAHELEIGKRKSGFKASFPNEMTIQIDKENKYDLERWRRIEDHMLFFRSGDEDDWGFEIYRLLNNLAGLVLPRAFGPLDASAYYLPADRTGVMHAHNVVVSALIERAAVAGLRPAARTPMLSGVLADFLEQLIDLERPPYRRHRPLGDLASQLEQSVLGGSVRVEKSESRGYPRFTYQPDRWKARLALTNASSMVSELAPVILYLRYIARSEDVIIVEEPESHLHPAMQVEFTRWLATLVRSGIRVLVTTHSEWVLEELSNVIRRSQLSRVERDRMDTGSYHLSAEQVGAWLFESSSRARGSRVREIKLDSGGLYPSGFERVATALHNDWADIEGQLGGDR